MTGPFAFVRLIGDREAIEKITTTWDKIVVDRSADLAETAGVIRAIARACRSSSSSTTTMRATRPRPPRQLRGLLGLPDPAAARTAPDDPLRLKGKP